MKKTTKKISAAALALVMGATAFTGCSGSTNSTPGGTDSAASTTSGGAATGSQKIMSSNENVKSAVDNVSVAEDYKDIKVDTKLKFMAWYDIQEASPAVELFKTLYGTPKNKPEGYESVADENVFVNVKVSNYNDRYLDLAKLVQSDESPDTFPFETSNYPYGIYQNLFQTIDGVVDTNTEDWVDYKPIIDKFNWGGKLVSNLYDANIEKCMDMLRTFDDTQEQLRYPREIENNWAPSYNEWADGNTLFIEDGTWRYEETWRKFKKKNKWEDDEINFVPFPQMDGADTYYQEMKQDAYMFVSGSKNADGYKAWIYANLLSSKDEEVKKAGRQQSIDEFDWNETLLDRLDKLKDPATFESVFEFKNGIGPDIADSTNGENAVGHLTSDVIMGGNSYTTVRDENKGVIEARIKELNATVS